jgi:hypothetical protein
VLYVGCLPVEVDPLRQEVCAFPPQRPAPFCLSVGGLSVHCQASPLSHHHPSECGERGEFCRGEFCRLTLGWLTLTQEVAVELYTAFNCCPVFLAPELKEKYYKGKRDSLLGL